MKRFFALAALVLGLAACQTEPEGLDVNVGGEVDTTITVSLPETTRANGNQDSAKGGVSNVFDEYDLRYILEVYNDAGVKVQQRMVKTTHDTSVAFEFRLIPNRNYR